MSNYSKQELEGMFQKRLDEGATTLNNVMQEVTSSGASRFIVPDDSMAPDFHAGDIVFHRPGSGDGFHILQNDCGAQIIRHVRIKSNDKILVSSPGGEEYELDYKNPGNNLVSIGSCFYSFRQPQPQPLSKTA